MDIETVLFLLALGPVSAAAFYWLMHRHYRNTDKSHAYERETAVQVLALKGAESDRKIDVILGTRASRIEGNNVSEHRQRVRPM
jgi:hypothetical protein